MEEMIKEGRDWSVEGYRFKECCNQTTRKTYK